MRSSVTATLGTNLENLVLIGYASIDGTGNSAANTLTGNPANNRLDGGSGSDTMIGGQGDDTYVVAQTGDVVTEATNEGVDLVQSSITYTLTANVESLTLVGASAISGTGNALNNILLGNSANNTLTGGAGADTLDGGSGTDTMRGGAGDDLYVVAQSSDVVTENANEGVDTVRAAITHTLATNVENLELTGTSALNGTGNTLNNVLTGNTAANTLTGAAGNDTLTGGGGADIYSYSSGHGADTINNASGDAAINDLDVTNLTRSQMTFVRSGADLLLNRNGVATDSIRVKNWFTTPTDQLDFVQFTDQTVTSWPVKHTISGARPAGLSDPADLATLDGSSTQAASLSATNTASINSAEVFAAPSIGKAWSPVPIRGAWRVRQQIAEAEGENWRVVGRLHSRGAFAQRQDHSRRWARMHALLAEHLADASDAIGGELENAHAPMGRIALPRDCPARITSAGAETRSTGRRSRSHEASRRLGGWSRCTSFSMNGRSVLHGHPCISDVAVDATFARPSCS